MPSSAHNVPLDPAFLRWKPWESLTLAEVEATRLLLRGDSSIDWHRLNFTSKEEVDNFLRVNLFDPEAPEDRHRIRVLIQKSVQYLRNHFNLRISPDLIEPPDIHVLFHHASFPERRFNRRKLLACMLLKVMSIIHHLEARALVFRTPMSDADMFRLVQDRINGLRTLLQQVGAPVADIYGNRKSEESLVSKLLSKKDTFAATVFDKFRYRIVVREKEDVLTTLAWLLRTFLPFNYVLPEKTFNNLVDPSEYLLRLTHVIPEMDGIRSNYRLDEGGDFRAERSNEFSGHTYRMVNLIADLPVRLDPFLGREEVLQFGRIGFALVELQVVDLRTEAENEEGENSHAAYKARQKERVLERLRWGGILKSHRAPRRRDLDGPDDDEPLGL